MIKCVVWDLDNTLLKGVFLEAGADLPEADPELLAVLSELSDRGIVQAVASRNPPEASRHAERVTGHKFAAIECGWDPKPDAIGRIMAELGLAQDEVAFVDDDALERAQVAYELPGILVLAPDEAAGMASWPEFSPAVVTDEARRRGESYRQRRLRQAEARAFGGSRDEFLRYCQTVVTIGAATPADLPRLHELSVRTNQFNTAGAELTEAELAGLLASAAHRLVTVRLRDRFGDDGLVGAAVVEMTAGTPVAGTPAAGAWQVPALMMSCRAIGRGVIDALLAWMCRAAAVAGAPSVTIPCLINQRNVPLRIALAKAGFRAVGTVVPPAPAGGTGPRMASFSRAAAGELPELPAWAHGEAG